MVVQINTVVISPSSSSLPSSSSPSSSTASGSSPSSTESDWLEMKMKTNGSPEPDHSPTQSSPELLPDGPRNNLILTPPSEFADSLLQSQQGTPKEQIYTTPDILLNCGGTYTIPGRLPPSVLQGHRHSPGGFPSVLGTIHSAENSGHAGGCVTESTSNSCVITRDSAVDATASAMNRGTPSNLATASTMNSTFELRSPSSAPRSVRRTPVIIASDSIIGNSTFAARSSFSFQPPSANNSRRTPSLLVSESYSSRGTPIILVTDSVMGNSTFGLQSLCSTGQSRSNSSQRTPSILDTNSVMGNSTMQTTTPPLQPAVSTSQPATNNLANETPLTGTSMWHASPMNLSEHPFASACCATTPQKNAFLTPSYFDREMERSEQMIDVTPYLNELAECWERLDSWKNNENELKEELGRIKDQLFFLLDTLGLSHDVYYNTVTPDDTPDPVHLRLRLHQSFLAAAETLAQHRENSQNVSSVISGNRQPTKSQRMSTPRSTPRRRTHGRQHGIDTSSSKYADLVIEQLLAKARSESNSSSSKSNSPPDPPRAADHDAAAICHAPDQLHSHPELDHNGARLPDSVNINRSSEDAVAKDSAKSKVIPVFSDYEACNGGDMILPEHLESAVTEEQELLVPTVTPEVLLSTSSSSAPTSSNGSSSNSSVPDLNKELVSRMQYYSDFTIDRQKKIDEAERNLQPVTETSDETSSAMTPPTECSSDHISPRCVEGSESVYHFKLPLPPRKLQPARTKVDKGKNYLLSETDESDTSSGTGSMPSSQQKSHPSSHHSSHSTKHSSRDRHSSRSSSGDHRSSSCGSRCSTHPLASSTFISDPNGGSPGSGSVYTWSLDNSSDENLYQSFLRSEKRRHKRSRRQRPKSCHSGTVIDSHSVARPETVIGADSPPHDNFSGAGSTVHLSHESSDIDSTPRRFGGNRFENSMRSSCVRSSSLPRTSTRIGGGFMLNGDMYHKASSSPGLSTPCSDFNYALSRIGPSNLSIDLQQPSSTDGSSSTSFKDRPELPGKSSTSDSTTSYYSQCLTCNPGLVAPPTNTSVRLMGNEDPCDDILTNSPQSFDSSGVQPPFNSYMSPADTSNDYTTVSNSSAESSIVASAPRQPRAFAMKSPGVFKVPFSPASRTVKRKAGGHSTHNVGVGTVGTPHFPVGVLKKEPFSRRKLFATSRSQLAGAGHAPKILDRKAIVQKFKRFTNNFKKDKDSSKLRTLANL